mmetsp:Transcript_14632/g.19255  ORF Transcript_14632/g.19255 Transcript_14632/m.19255 type:complete len:270 (+) Transcript_14632:268-1077(+)
MNRENSEITNKGDVSTNSMDFMELNELDDLDLLSMPDSEELFGSSWLFESFGAEKETSPSFDKILNDFQTTLPGITGNEMGQSKTMESGAKPECNFLPPFPEKNPSLSDEGLRFSKIFQDKESNVPEYLKSEDLIDLEHGLSPSSRQNPKLLERLLSFPSMDGDEFLSNFSKDAATNQTRKPLVIPQLSEHTLLGITTEPQQHVLMQYQDAVKVKPKKKTQPRKVLRRSSAACNLKREEAKRRKRYKGKFCKEEDPFVPVNQLISFVTN